VGDNTMKGIGNKEVATSLFNKTIHSDSPGTIEDCAAGGDCINSFSRFFGTVCDSFRNCDLTIDNMMVRDDRVLVRYKLQGTQTREFKGVLAIGQTVTVNGLDIFRLNDGKVIEHWDTVYQVGARPGI
jgi:predicted SnoaL-like aldol condensation-catalyzing enzyme